MSRSNRPVSRSLAILATIGLLMTMFPSVIAAAGEAGPPTTLLGVQPVAEDGNRNCSLPGDGDFELRINAPQNGTFTHTLGDFSVSITTYNTPDGQAFDFEVLSGGTIETLYVKAGPDTNVYDFGAGATADDFLHGTINPNNGRFYGLSHLSLCYNLSTTTSVSTVLHERTDATGTQDVDPANNGTSITVAIGAFVNDVATVLPATATGTVSFAYYASLADCESQTNGTAAGSSAVSSGLATSSTVQFNAADTLWWRAAFDGTGNFNDSLSPCDEVLTIDPNDPAIVTSQTEVDADPANTGQDITVTIGASVTDTATLSGATSDAGGTIDFEVYGPSDPDCEGTPVFTDLGNAVSGNGDYTSDAFTPTAVGTYTWVVSYSGDANNNPASSDCGVEVLTVGLNQPTIETAPWVIPQDDATLANLFGVGPFGTLEFELFDNADCSGDAIFSQTVTVTGDGTFSTTNSGDPAVGDGVSIMADGTFYWVVTYSGNSDNASATSECGDEILVVDVTPNAAP